MHDGPDIDPDKRDVNPSRDQRYINYVTGFVKEHLPHLDKEPAVYEKGMYTVSLVWINQQLLVLSIVYTM